MLYTQAIMQGKLLEAYEEVAKGTKTLIFNAGILTSIAVYETFKKKGLPVRHLDSTFSDKDRAETLEWFRNTKNGILTSVSILTTGFDEPEVETIMLNRATKSLTLYHQMIGRGSRVLPNKKQFKIIDLGNFTELKTTRVIPSPRVSNRVPFGTGRAVGDFLLAGETIRKTYSLQSFEWIRKFVSELDRLYVCELSELPLIANDSDHGLTSLRFFEMEGLPVALQEIRKNSPSPEAFLRRFLKWFDAFRVLKLVHYLRDSLYPDVPVIQAAGELLRYLEVPLETDDSHQLLNHYLKLDRL